MNSLFILWGTVGPRTTETAAGLIAQGIARRRDVPLFLTDGWKPYTAALLQVLGRIYRPRRKKPSENSNFHLIRLSSKWIMAIWIKASLWRVKTS